MATTRSSLVAAKIYEVDESGNETGGLSVDCMFNPYEYTVSKSNSYKEQPKRGANAPAAEFTKSGSQSLKLQLVFDAYETGEDISKQTNKLWKFMQASEKSKPSHKGDKIQPPQVAFEWGVFRFVAFITNMTQKFTLFKNDGTPVRASVDVQFTQYIDPKEFEKQNPSSGGGPSEQLWRVVVGDRLDTIAAEVYRDATRWRRIADHNKITNPLALRPGQVLRIPLD